MNTSSSLDLALSTAKEGVNTRMETKEDARPRKPCVLVFGQMASLGCAASQGVRLGRGNWLDVFSLGS